MGYYRFKILAIAIGIVTIAMPYTGAAFASHSFEAGVKGDTIPDNTHIRLDGLSLPPTAALPLYDASPNFISGHFLMRTPCDSTTHVPVVTVIAGHIDESVNFTYVDKIPLYYIDHASTADSCVYHAHIPDPLNSGAPKVTDIALINLSGNTINFNPGDVVDINVQRVLGNIASDPYNSTKLPGELSHGNTVYDLNDEDTSNDGMGFHSGEEQ